MGGAEIRLTPKDERRGAGITAKAEEKIRELLRQGKTGEARKIVDDIVKQNYNKYNKLSGGEGVVGSWQAVASRIFTNLQVEVKGEKKVQRPEGKGAIGKAASKDMLADMGIYAENTENELLRDLIRKGNFNEVRRILGEKYDEIAHKSEDTLLREMTVNAAFEYLKNLTEQIDNVTYSEVSSEENAEKKEKLREIPPETTPVPVQREAKRLNKTQVKKAGEEAAKLLSGTEFIEKILNLDMKEPGYGNKNTYKGKGVMSWGGVYNDYQIGVVQALYNKLVENGDIEGEKIKVDGIYGMKTQEAIKKMQELFGMKGKDVDGYFGVDTRAAFITWVSERTTEAKKEKDEKKPETKKELKPTTEEKKEEEKTKEGQQVKETKNENKEKAEEQNPEKETEVIFKP